MAAKIACISFCTTLVSLATCAPVEEKAASTTPLEGATEQVIERSVRKAWMQFPQGTQWANLAWEFKRDDLRSADVISVDLFDTDESEIQAHKKKGRAVICYLSAGTLEHWRPDAGDVSRDLLGLQYHGKSSEKWFDITKWSQLKGFIGNRLNIATGKGCDAIEYDNIDCYGNSCVKGMDKWDLKNYQIDYAQWLADAAHSRGMAAGFKNAVDLIDDLLWDYDFAINESCTRFHECYYYDSFKSANKAVFGVEYQAGNGACSQAAEHGIAMKINHGNSWRNC